MTAGDAYYVLVRNHTEGFDLHGRLRRRGLDVRIAPAPHGLQACCGMSILVRPADKEAVCAAIAEEGVPIEDVVKVAGAIDPARDRYC